MVNFHMNKKAIYEEEIFHEAREVIRGTGVLIRI